MLITIYLYSLIFILGTIIGSFLNVCIYRIPAGLSIVKPRSRCGSCERTLSAVDLVPILSWIFLKGKCRSCGAKISARYPLVEALEGALFLLIFMRFGVSFLTLTSWLFAAFLTVVFFIDIDHKIIPNKLVLFGCTIGLIPVLLHFTVGYQVYFSRGILEPILGIIVPFTLMLATALLSILIMKKPGMGMGDVKVYAPIGLFLGWQFSLMSLWFAFFFGGLFGLYWMVILRKSKADYIPFAPFIVIGSLIALLYGKAIYILLLM